VASGQVKHSASPPGCQKPYSHSTHGEVLLARPCPGMQTAQGTTAGTQDTARWSAPCHEHRWQQVGGVTCSSDLNQANTCCYGLDPDQPKELPGLRRLLVGPSIGCNPGRHMLTCHLSSNSTVGNDHVPQCLKPCSTSKGIAWPGLPAVMVVSGHRCCSHQVSDSLLR
jgi:hypothetical protein